ncbi:hypothetical protein TNCT_104191 [Trichonephila clavata]|uniref:Uncharacterized protein n=1 Tax=Trichonephila clavata TaxID=2740835 RepID=A0A8X6JFL9_TRICU|nr:hypothetical protein TNCT_104191 [Trichonephila clavata]
MLLLKLEKKYHRISQLKDLILNSNEYKNDTEFVQEFLNVSERKLQEAEKNKELEIRKLEAEKELELARIQCQNREVSLIFF